MEDIAANIGDIEGELKFRESVSAQHKVDKRRLHWVECRHCKKMGLNFKSCGGCRVAVYCSRDCQRDGWAVHKGECAELKALQEDASSEDVNALSVRLKSLWARGQRREACKVIKHLLALDLTECKDEQVTQAFLLKSLAWEELVLSRVQECTNTLRKLDKLIKGGGAGRVDPTACAVLFGKCWSMATCLAVDVDITKEETLAAARFATHECPREALSWSALGDALSSNAAPACRVTTALTLPSSDAQAKEEAIRAYGTAYSLNDGEINHANFTRSLGLVCCNGSESILLHEKLVDNQASSHEEYLSLFQMAADAEREARILGERFGAMPKGQVEEAIRALPYVVVAQAFMARFEFAEALAT